MFYFFKPLKSRSFTSSVLCYFTSLLLMDNHHSSLLLTDMYFFPHVQKIPTDGEAQLWGGNLMLGQKDSTELPAAAIKLLLIFSLAVYYRDPSVVVRSPCMLLVCEHRAGACLHFPCVVSGWLPQ